MNWLLGILAIGIAAIAVALWWQQAKADQEFRDWLEKQ